MRLWLTALATSLCSLTLPHPAQASGFPLSSNANALNPRVFSATGVVEEIQPGNKTIIIQHEAISNYMAAMTMPFKVKSPVELAGRQRGDEITFQLHVSDNESWVDHLVKTGTAPQPANKEAAPVPAPHSQNSLLDYHFTNELGQPVCLNDFRGQALAITFIFTRCPLPEFCPRLSRNFQEASQKLAAMTNAPANWHFLSVTFDPEFDSPARLKAYGEMYQSDPAHWSFLTGPTNEIRELARQSGVVLEAQDGTFNHNFRTLIIDAAGHLQTVFPTSGDLSDAIAAEMLKAATVKN